MESLSNSTSYPPEFRPLLSKPTEPEKSIEPSLDRSNDILIPVIDLEHLDMEKLRDACRDWGIFHLENTGIPSTLMSQVKEITKSVLSLPFEEKRKLFPVKSPLSYFWGTNTVTPSGNALKRPPRESSGQYLFEGINVPLASLSRLLPLSCSDPNLESFKVVMEEYGKHVTRIVDTVFEALAETLSLELSGDRKTSCLSESTCVIRVQRYPPCTESPGFKAHTDSSMISIINQDEVGGLEFMKDGEWFNVTPLANSLVIGLGDMMQVLSDEEYKSVLHKVGKRMRKKERYSIIYFVFPDKDCMFKSSRYKPFTFSEYEAQVKLDVETHGIKVGLSRLLSNP
ncbi:Gibberellin 2-beta-dioxygenase 6 [Cardamine amara subsp. amara]|uniref:Gibberellin 2-beta-dioxygenase 6 n=1 Tax=Cardamine amara subsp. amara TaxID=228776 RepID=A0ABD1BSL4_CARAN